MRTFRVGLTGKHGRMKSGSRRTSSSSLIPSVQDMGELERARQESVAMKAKIRSLEMEVDALKQRLESLRKAKSTTIIKREREEIHVHTPNLGRRHSSLSGGLQQTGGSWLAQHSRSLLDTKEVITQKETEFKEQLTQQKQLLENSRNEVQKLTIELRTCRTTYDAKITSMENEHNGTVSRLEEQLKNKEKLLDEERKKAQEVNIHVQCPVTEGIEDELEKLRKLNKELENQLSELVDSNVHLRDSNLILQGKCETLLEDLSVKEAQWTEKEERLHAEIRKQWGERYHQWIAKAERKMEELQQINVMLQTVLKTKSQNPDL